MSDEPPPHATGSERFQRRSAPCIVRRLRSVMSPDPVTTGLDATEGLLADVVTMSRQAAVDGLPLSAVFDELRMVLSLEPTDVVPADVLRACALAWARVNQELGRGVLSHVDSGTLEDLESSLWALMASSPERLPGWVVIVYVRAVPAPGAVEVEPTLAAALRPADLLRGAGQQLAGLLDLPGERVLLIREPGGGERERLAALVARTPVRPGQNAEDRVSLVRASLASLEPVSGGGLVVSVHSLIEHPEGMIAAVREALLRSGWSV